MPERRRPRQTKVLRAPKDPPTRPLDEPEVDTDGYPKRKAVVCCIVGELLADRNGKLADHDAHTSAELVWTSRREKRCNYNL
jgi:hypothetical protein